VKQFRFEKCWLNIDDFHQLVANTWNKPCNHTEPLMCGNIKLGILGKLSKVGLSIESLSKKMLKKLLIAEYNVLDILSETQLELKNK
jgi:hypothetical protein